jgi:hypothetical protein
MAQRAGGIRLTRREKLSPKRRPHDMGCTMLIKSLNLSLLLIVLASGAGGAETATSEWPSPITWKPDPRAVKSGLYIEPKTAVKKQPVPFTVREPSGIARKAWPVRGSIPLFRGELGDAKKVRLIDAQGKPVAVQAIATAFWPEKSVRFLCLDFVADFLANEELSFTLEYGTEVPKFDEKGMIKSEQAGACQIASTGNTYAFKSGPVFLEVRNDKAKRTVPVSGEAKIASDEKGTGAAALALNVDEITITERGPVQTTVHLVGHYGSDKTAFTNWSSDPGYLPSFRDAPRHHDYWRYPVSMHFRIYHGSDQVYLEHCFGYNGDEYAHFVQSYGLKLATGMKDGVFGYGPDESTQATSALGVRINQFAHDRWTLTGKAQAEGKRFGGWAAITGKGWSVVAALRDGWQNWPVAIRAEDNGDLIYEIFGEKPDRALDLRYRKNPGSNELNKSHSMYMGEALSSYYCNTDQIGRAAGLRKIHEMLLCFTGDELKSADFARAHQKPILPWPGQKRFEETRAMGLIRVFEGERWDYLKQYYKIFLSVMPVFHEANGMYGWVDWGDVPMLDANRNGKFVLDLQGAYGWSNGERALCSYFYQYVATGDRAFIDMGRAMTHHCIGIDTEHEGGDYPHGSYARHDQVHWREWDPMECRQGGYRGWHNYAWLTGDPEVRRLALSAGIDAASNRRNMDVANPNEAVLKIGDNQSSNQMLAHMCWITTGDWRYARAHHAVAQATEHYSSMSVGIPAPYELRVPKSGVIDCAQLPASGVGQTGYWFTYGGDDLLLEWIQLTGDGAAVGAVLQEARMVVPAIGNYAIYHQPEALLLAAAYLDPANPHLVTALHHRQGLIPALGYFLRDKTKAPEGYQSADHWANYNTNLYGKNGWSIYGCMGQEMLQVMAAFEHLESKPEPILALPHLQLPAILHAEDDKDHAVVEIDGSKTIATPDEIKEYTWYLNDKKVSAGPKTKLEIPIGPARVALEVTAKDGMKMKTQCALTVLASNESKFYFGSGPSDFLSGNVLYNESAGYGWSAQHPDNAYTQNAAYNDPTHAYGCGSLKMWRTVDFQVKVQPGATYVLEMGATALANLEFRTPSGVNGQPIQTTAIPGAPYSWAFKGDVKPDAQGLIRINCVRDGPEYPVLSYVIMRKKK